MGGRELMDRLMDKNIHFGLTAARVLEPLPDCLTTIEMVDDFHGSVENVTTVRSSLDGVDYEIDPTARTHASCGGSWAATRSLGAASGPNPTPGIRPLPPRRARSGSGRCARATPSAPSAGSRAVSAPPARLTGTRQPRSPRWSCGYSSPRSAVDPGSATRCERVRNQRTSAGARGERRAEGDGLGWLKGLINEGERLAASIALPWLSAPRGGR